MAVKHGDAMKNFWLLALAVVLTGCGRHRDSTSRALLTSNLPPKMVSFVAQKEQHARELARNLNIDLHGDYWTFFRHARSGDWPAANRVYESLLKGGGQQ